MVRLTDTGLIRPLNEVLQTSSYWRDNYCTLPRANRSHDAVVAKAALRESMQASLDALESERRAARSEDRSKFRLSQEVRASLCLDPEDPEEQKLDPEKQKLATSALRHFAIANLVPMSGLDAKVIWPHLAKGQVSAEHTLHDEERKGGEERKGQANHLKEERAPLLDAIQIARQVEEWTFSRKQASNILMASPGHQKQEVAANKFEKSQSREHWLTQKDRRIERMSTPIRPDAELPDRPKSAGPKGSVRRVTSRYATKCVTPAVSSTRCATPRISSNSGTPRPGTPQNASPWTCMLSRPQSGKAWSQKFLAHCARAAEDAMKQCDHDAEGAGEMGAAVQELQDIRLTDDATESICSQDEVSRNEAQDAYADNSQEELQPLAFGNIAVAEHLEKSLPAQMHSNGIRNSKDAERLNPVPTPKAIQKSLNVRELVLSDNTQSGEEDAAKQSRPQTARTRGKICKSCDMGNSFRQQRQLQTETDLTTLCPTVHKKSIRVRWMLDHALMGDYCPLRALPHGIEKIQKMKSTEGVASYFGLEQNSKSPLPQANFSLSAQPGDYEGSFATLEKMSRPHSHNDSHESDHVPSDVEEVAGTNDLEIWKAASESATDSASKGSDSIDDSRGAGSVNSSSALGSDTTDMWLAAGHRPLRNGRQSIQADAVSRRHRNNTSPVSSRSD